MLAAIFRVLRPHEGLHSSAENSNSKNTLSEVSLTEVLTTVFRSMLQKMLARVPTRIPKT